VESAKRSEIARTVHAISNTQPINHTVTLSEHDFKYLAIISQWAIELSQEHDELKQAVLTHVADTEQHIFTKDIELYELKERLKND
jgi:hypothetical protein